MSEPKLFSVEDALNLQELQAQRQAVDVHLFKGPLVSHETPTQRSGIEKSIIFFLEIALYNQKQFLQKLWHMRWMDMKHHWYYLKITRNSSNGYLRNGN